jgi:hypothetical protein
MNEATRKKVPTYFRSLKLHGALFVVATLGIVMLIAASGLWKLLAASILIGAAGVGYYSLENSPSDAEIDAMVSTDITALKRRALERCHLEAETDEKRNETIRDPEIIFGIPFRLRPARRVRFGFRRGSDGIVRFTPLHVSIVNFTAHQLLVYQCALDLMTGERLNESCDEFFYTHVASYSLYCETYTYEKEELVPAFLKHSPRSPESTDEKIRIVGADLFRLVTTGGTSIEIMLNAQKLIERLGGGEVNVDPSKDAVSAIVRMLRDKQEGALPLRQHTLGP